MSEIISNKVDISSEGDSRIIHGFHTISPDSRPISQKSSTRSLESDTRIYQKIGDIISIPKDKPIPLKSTVLGATFMLTNFCLGTTIYTFAVRAKSFGLIWILVSCVLTGIINYWTIMRGIIASFKYKEYDYSELTEKILGRKIRVCLNIFIILYSYACMMCFLSLVFILSGRFVQSIFYPNKYNTYEEFEQNQWGKTFIKFPFFVAITFFVGIICLKRDIKKLNFLTYSEVITVTYTLLIVLIECNGYYNYYKKTKYIKNDKKTHPNWFNLGNAFTKDLDFFKGMANLFCAYACHSRVYSVFTGFKVQKDELKKMRYGVFFSTCLTTGIYILSIICSFLTDPYMPEDLIVYRKNKENGKDIAMTISKLLISLNLLFTIPGYYFSLRTNIANTFNKGDISDKFNYILTLISCLICGIIAAFYNKILNYLSYIGVFSVFICYLNPILIYVYSTEKKFKYWKNIIEIILAIILCLIGITAGIVTIIDDIKN